MFVPNLTAAQRDNIKLWIEALKASKFTQTNGCLHDDKGYCCLGVAVELIHGNSVWQPLLTNERHSYLGRRQTNDRQTQDMLPSDADINHYGLSTTGVNYLSELNDMHKYTFHDIAIALKTALYFNAARE